MFQNYDVISIDDEDDTIRISSNCAIEADIAHMTSRNIDHANSEDSLVILIKKHDIINQNLYARIEFHANRARYLGCAINGQIIKWSQNEIEQGKFSRFQVPSSQQTEIQLS